MSRFSFRTRTGEIFNIIQQGFDIDSIAFINRVTTAGGTLSAIEQNAVNQLVVDLKKNNLWLLMKAVYPMVGASAVSCSQNLISSSYTGTFSTGWTYSSNGVTPNGTNAYFNTSLILNNSVVNNSIHLSYYSRTQKTTESGTEMGASDVSYTNEYGLDLYFAGVSAKVFVSGGYPTYSATSTNNNTLGLCIGSRTFNNSSKLYMNGTQVGSTNTASYPNYLPKSNIYIGCTNANGTGVQFSSKQCAFSSIGDGLNDTQASNLYTVVQNFQTSLGRQV